MELIKRFLTTISYTNRHKKQINQITQEVNKYRGMSDNEFLLEYVNINSKYESKKMRFTTLIVAIIIVIITNIWSNIYSFLASLFTVRSKIDNTEEVKMFTSIFLIVIAIGILLFVLIILCSMFKTICDLNKKRILLEQVKDMREYDR